MRRLLLLGICLVLVAGLFPLSLAAESFADPAFESVWQRTDKPVESGRVARSWVWGPSPLSGGIQEPYAEALGGTRLVQYFDKSRMEINDPNADRNSQWFVTNGLLVREMVDGRIVTGASASTPSTPSQEAVADDTVIYLVQNGKRHAFPDWDTFVGRGYNLQMVKTVSWEQLNAIPLGSPIPSVHACQSGMALVKLDNRLGSTLHLSLTGPENVDLTVGANSARNVCLYAGDYSYYGWASGYGSLSGTKHLGSGDCLCWFWYSGAEPGGCGCSDSLGDYSRP